jgi:hypothetical protein
MSHVTAIKQAKYAFDHRENATREEKVNAVIELAEWNLFSNRQLAHLTGLNRGAVAGVNSKTDRTGGALDGEALAPILELIATNARGDKDDSAIRRAIDAGASGRMVARLTGISQSAVSRASRRVAA